MSWPENSSSGFESSIPSKEWLDDSSSAETPLAAEPETTPQIVLFRRFSTPSPVTVKEQRSEEFLSDAELLRTPPLPIAASPRAARTGPIKTVMEEEDEELEKMMLSLSPPKCPTQQRSPAATACPVFSAAGEDSFLHLRVTQAASKDVYTLNPPDLRH
ncbi:hypothetical protein PDJAM_G00196210 [Pangasius djambal]|uniref:Uncharacterized protein n=1 Tax=Pangasius djambal TaxID=1691987 RepID=A0ACC5Y5Z3_9TELE|nr:hypothetical protein [Pangasius djambal]